MSFNHDGLLAVERQPFLIICVGKEDRRTLCNSLSDEHEDT